MEGSSPARAYALAVGATLTILGIAGFFYDGGASFDVGEGVRSSDALEVFAVNGWHNVIHIVTGVLGLLAASYAARLYALALGTLYVAVAALGFLDFGSVEVDDTILDAIPVNTPDNLLHLALGVLGLAAGV